MIKIFLVEDEVIMRNGIKTNINWEKENLEFVGEAGDGELAYPLIKKTRPDILITDIQMPFMDGLELSRIVKRELPKTKIIILSGYGEFEYAKQAISIGITDYLLKPISSAKLLEAVKNVVKSIEKEKKEEELLIEYQKEMEESNRTNKQKLLFRLISGSLSPAEILDQGRALGIEFLSSLYLVMRFTLLQNENEVRMTEHLEKVSEMIKNEVQQEEQIQSVGLGIEGFAFLMGGESETGILELQNRWAGRLKQIVKDSGKLHFFGGVGKTVQRLGDIAISYQDANRTFASRFFLHTDQIVTHDQVEQLLHTENQIDWQELCNSKQGRSRIESFLKNGTIEEVEEFIEEYFRNIGEKNHNSLMFRQYMVMDMFLKAADFLGNIEVSMDELAEQSQAANEIVTKAGSLECIQQYLNDLLVKVLSLRDKMSQKKYGILLEDAKRYMKENFQNSDISLNMVAAYVSISPSYFSTVFSQEIGQTFVEFLTNLRIEKAKELLMCTGLRTSEVGYQIGYKDAHYFSYIFKKMMNCTPKEYRMRGKEQAAE